MLWLSVGIKEICSAWISKLGSRRQGVTKGCRGFSLLELVVVIVLVSFLVVIALARLLAIQADAERVSMEMVLGTLRSAIGMKVAELIVRQDFNAMKALEGTNPMDRLAELPPNYLGPLATTDPKSLKNGNWYFDVGARSLVYLVRNQEQFSGGVTDPARARFAIQLVYVDKNSNGRFDLGIDSIEGLRLSALEPYTWVR